MLMQLMMWVSSLYCNQLYYYRNFNCEHTYCIAEKLAGENTGKLMANCKSYFLKIYRIFILFFPKSSSPNNLNRWIHQCFLLPMFSDIKCNPKVYVNWDCTLYTYVSICTCMCVYISMQMCACVCTCVAICVSMWACVYACACMHGCVYEYVCLCARVCMCAHVCMHVYMFTCICACVCVHVCMCMCPYMCLCPCVCPCVGVCACMWAHKAWPTSSKRLRYIMLYEYIYSL